LIIREHYANLRRRENKKEVKMMREYDENREWRREKPNAKILKARPRQMELESTPSLPPSHCLIFLKLRRILYLKLTCHPSPKSSPF
jgi:hypothetical protein